jgi:hypothetical protein
VTVVGMATFRDRVLLELSDAGQLAGLLLPAGDTTGSRVRTMLGASYDLTSARIDSVRSVAVTSVVLERPLFPVGRQTGGWQQTVPTFTRTDLSLDVPAPADPVWVDLLAQLSVTVVTEVDPGGAESVLAKGFDEFTTLDEFRARFVFIDLDEFMARHHITTVEELRDAFDYIVTEVRLRTPPPFDPADPANTHILAVTLAAAVVDPLDLAEGLRTVRLIQAATKDLTGPKPASVPAEPVAAYATAAVFATAALGAAGLTAAEVEQLYAQQGVVSLFLTAN